MVIIDDIAKLLLEWKWFQIFPSKLLCFENVYSVLQFINLLRFLGYESFWFLQHSTKDDNIIRIKAEGEVICDFLRDLDV